MQSLTGNFEGVVQTGGTPLYIGLSLEDNGGVVAGIGFLGAPGYRSFTAIATGSTEGEFVELEVSPGGSGVTYQFTGRRHGDTISGSFELAEGFDLPLEMVRVDTVATGRQSISLSLSTIREESGSAYFEYFLSPVVYLVLKSAGNGPHLQLDIIWDGTHYPPAGMYQVGATGGPRVFVDELARNTEPRPFTVESGAIVLDRVHRWALIGSLDIIARDPEGNQTRIQGTFSAGCVNELC